MARSNDTAKNGKKRPEKVTVRNGELIFWAKKAHRKRPKTDEKRTKMDEKRTKMATTTKADENDDDDKIGRNWTAATKSDQNGPK